MLRTMLRYKRYLKISWLWIPYVLLIQLVPIEKVIWYIFIMLSIHEMAHIVCAIIFHYPIQSVVIYPFGLAANIKDLGKGHVGKEILILLAGPCTHLLTPILFQIMANMHIISIAFALYLNKICISIMIFNLLPIYPLDGGRIMQSILHFFFRYKTANQLSYILSLFVLVFIFYYRIIYGISAWILFVFLCISLVVAFYQSPYTTLSFYHYRWLHPITYKMIRNKKQDLFRCRYNLIQKDKEWYGEEAWLNHMFRKK